MRLYIQNILFCILLLFAIYFFLRILLNKNETFDYIIPLRTQEYLNPTFIECVDENPVKHVSQQGEYIVINNFVRGSKTFKCDESITYTTQGDYTFLDNVPILVSRWMGPISISMYAPGDDFLKTMESIAYLRVCENEYIEQLVTFHVFFSNKHLPQIKSEGGLMEAYEDTYNCSNGPPFKNVTRDYLYRRKNKLYYPINVGRNIARQAAVTHFVLCSDIELYPSPNFIDNFLKMYAGLPDVDKKVPSVYPITVFELVENTVLPENKTILQKLMKEEVAFWFHKRLCTPCHILPKEKEWLAANESEGTEIFTITKRKEKYKNIESFYVGTKSDPLFDERLMWEGQSDKLQQAYVQCLLNYDYKLLSNAFLVHKPEIKKVTEQWTKHNSYVLQTNKYIKEVIMPQMNRLYGLEDELNEMECRPPIGHVTIEGEIASNDLTVVVQPSLADDPMVVGPRYQAKDLKCSWSNYLGTASSGVLLLGLQRGTSLAKTIRENYPTRAYRIKGSLGQATENFYKDGKVIERSTFKHVKLYNMEKLLANMQAAHQRKMFELCGVDMQSQMAYEIAIQGLIRPSQSKIPLIYGIKCVYFKPPEFIIEVLCVNEYEMYLKALINEIGIKLHSTAHCTGIQCIRHSHFSLENALLKRQWSLQNFVTNMEDCSKIFSKNNNILNQENVALRSS